MSNVHFLHAELRTNVTLETGGGGCDDGGMEARVTRLEVEFEHVRVDLDEIKADLKKLVAGIGDIPTKADLWSFKIQWIAIMAAAVAIIVGGIIGGLSWIKPEAPTAIQSPPIIIQVPPYQPPLHPEQPSAKP